MSGPEQSPPHVQADATGKRWSLHWDGTRFDVRLYAGALLCDYFGPEMPAPPAPLWTGWREHDLLQNARLPAMVGIGPRADCVVWQLHQWNTPAPGCLVVTLMAEQVPLECEVTLEVDIPTGILRRGTVLRNRDAMGSPPIMIGGALSLWITLRGEIKEAEFLTGNWGGEAQPTALPGGHAALELDSRTGKTGFEFQPWLSLRLADATYLCELLWSGNWSLNARLRPTEATLSGGLNDWGFAHDLASGAALALPDVLLAYVPGDPDAATRRLHDWRRTRRPDPRRPVPVQFNTWYPCDETPDATRLRVLIPLAARLGCEVFVLDAGWYASRDGDPNTDWYMRAGDWTVDRQRFPDGLGWLSGACATVGMGFGIWCEPEAVGPRARLRHTHPEWLHHLDGIPPAPGARALLHLGVPQAWAHVHDLLTELIRDTGATWLKWDFNANLDGGGWAPGLPAELIGQDPLVAHYQGLYRLLDALRAAFPHLVLEMCASGAGRMDGAILSHAHTNWLSDQPRAVAKLAIHFGMQRAHPAVCCNDWLVDWPPRAHSGVLGIDHRGDLAFRLRVAMLGSFGISASIDRWNEADLAVASAHVSLYRDRLRPLIQDGDQYQLTEAPPLDGHGDWAAMWYVAKDGRAGVLFAFRLEGAAHRDFSLPGLREGGWTVAGDGASLNDGRLRISLPDQFRSALLLVEVVAQEAGEVRQY